MSAALSAPSLSDRLGAAIELLCRAVAAHGPRHGAASSLTVLAWNRLRRLFARFAALVAAVQAGRLPVPRRTAGKTARPRPASPDAPRLPGASGWLLQLAPALDTRLGRAWVESLVADPELGALVAQAPQAGRILRPLCHALGIELPPALRLPRNPRPRRTPGASGSTASEEQRPETPPARRRRPSWLSRPRSPPLPRLEPTQADAPRRPARTGPPGN